jgi:hypothetical protein
MFSRHPHVYDGVRNERHLKSGSLKGGNPMQRLSSTNGILLSVAVFLCLFVSTTVQAQSGIFTRGDANVDSAVDITDAIYGMRHLFTAGPPGPCQDAMDTDDDGALTIADPLSSLFFLFGGQR